MKILECSSKGDKRFSAFYAKITVFNKYNSIENHYQSVKWKNIGKFKSRCKKGEKVDFININGIKLEPKFLTQFYKLLWCKYLDEHIELVEYAKQFDEFNDMFKGKSINCQADVIRQYVKEGRKSIIKECRELIDILNNN